MSCFGTISSKTFPVLIKQLCTRHKKCCCFLYAVKPVNYTYIYIYVLYTRTNNIIYCTTAFSPITDL